MCGGFYEIATMLRKKCWQFFEISPGSIYDKLWRNLFRGLMFCRFLNLSHEISPEI